MFRCTALFSALFVFCLSAKADDPAPEAAAPTPEHIWDYRHNTFEALGKHMRVLGMMVKGKVPAQQADLVAHASSLHAMSTLIPTMFPDGTGPDVVADSEALPAVWTDRDGFNEKAEVLQTESSTLVELATSGDIDGFKAQFGKVGRACGGCHDGFKKDDDH